MLLHNRENFADTSDILRPDDNSIHKDIIYGEMTEWNKPQQKRFKGGIQKSSSHFDIDPPNWKIQVADRNSEGAKYTNDVVHSI